MVISTITSSDSDAEAVACASEDDTSPSWDHPASHGCCHCRRHGAHQHFLPIFHQNHPFFPQALKITAFFCRYLLFSPKTVVFPTKIVYTILIDIISHICKPEKGGNHLSLCMAPFWGILQVPRFEFSKPDGFHHKRVDLFANSCFYTDDTVMTIATKYAVKKGVPYAKAYSLFGRKYPKVGYGTMFKKWLDTGSQKGYNSYGNGSAMRVSYIGRHFKTLEEVEREAGKSASCTHNHPEGIKGAVAAAGCTFLAPTAIPKKETRRYATQTFGYKLSKPLFLLQAVFQIRYLLPGQPAAGTGVLFGKRQLGKLHP